MKTRYIIKVETFDLSNVEVKLAGYVSKNVDKPKELVQDPEYALSFAEFSDACDWAVFFREQCPEPLRAYGRFTVVARI